MSLEIHSFAKGIRDLYRVIAPIAFRKVTVSPRINPTKYFRNKLFSQKIISDWAYSGGLFEFEEGGMFSRNQKYYQDNAEVMVRIAFLRDKEISVE